MGIKDLWIKGDSWIVIDWLKGKSRLFSTHLHYWCQRVKVLLSHFTSVSFDRVLHQFNQEADLLSKKGLGGQAQILFYMEYEGAQVVNSGIIKMF